VDFKLIAAFLGAAIAAGVIVYALIAGDIGMPF
jgi:hypothetical protein